jgi:serine/threonine protein kinase
MDRLSKARESVPARPEARLHGQGQVGEATAETATCLPMRQAWLSEEKACSCVFNKDAIPGYVILNEVGKGAMGTVYAARDARTGRLVAVKVLYPYFSHNKELITRLTREAEITRKLRHPNAVSGIASGRCALPGHLPAQAGAGQYYYFVMEFVEGKSLLQLIRRDGFFTEKQAAAIALDVAKALEAAHRLKIIHRDIKPANIIITPKGGVKLTDFGLAREEVDTSLTLHGTILGTPCYISPEQARGDRNLDIRSDIYSLGITFFHMLTGAPPWAEFSTPLLLTKKTVEEIPSPRLWRDGLSDAVCAIVAKMCRRDRRDRYATPHDLIEDLERFIADRYKVEADFVGAGLKPAPTGAIKKILEKQVRDPALRALLASDAVARLERIVLERNEILFYEEDNSREAYLLVRGEIEVLKAGRQIAKISEPGSFLGEMSTLLNVNRTATVRALRTSLLLKITEETFQDFLRSAPQLAEKLARDLARRLQETSDRLRDAQSRLASIKEYHHFMHEELQP